MEVVTGGCGLSLQGLRSGNFSFQVAGVDAAGNQGAPGTNYLFSVDSSLEPDGQRRAAFWGLGWKFWLIVAGSGALIVAASAAVAAVIISRRRRGSRHDLPHTVFQVRRSLLNTITAGRTDSCGLRCSCLV